MYAYVQLYIIILEIYHFKYKNVFYIDDIFELLVMLVDAFIFYNLNNFVQFY